MTKKLPVLFLFLLFLFFSPNANAQTASGTATKLNDQMQLIKDQRQSAISRIKDTKMQLRQKIKDTAQMKREEVKTAVKVKRDEFKAKIQTLKDEKKKALVERIDTKLSNVNTKHTDRFTEILNKLQTLLDKMSFAATDPKVVGDIASAQTAIDKAAAAVETQAAKTYIIQITDESSLKNNVGKTTSALRLDLMATHKTIVDAKQAVQSIRKNSVLMKKEATNSANL